MKRLFVSMLAMGGFLLFGMQAAESASLRGKSSRAIANKPGARIRNPAARAVCVANKARASRSGDHIAVDSIDLSRIRAGGRGSARRGAALKDLKTTKSVGRNAKKRAKASGLTSPAAALKRK
jgi:hypothetical protein